MKRHSAIFFTALALIAFAANSVLGRLALTDTALNATDFTAIRLASGAVMLAVLVWLRMALSASSTPSSSLQASASAPDAPLKKAWHKQGSWLASGYLGVYALTFSIAYLSLDTGTGALILFAAVQLGLIGYRLAKGNPLSKLETLGVLIAFAGFVYLMLPTLSTPSWIGLVLMSVSGLAWAGYTVLGANCADPLAHTAANFVRTLPFALVLLAFIDLHSLTFYSLSLSIAAGAITSGLGYAIWYLALRNLTATSAGVLQLLVPVLAAIGGFIFAAESPDPHFYIALVGILGGIYLVLKGRK